MRHSVFGRKLSRTKNERRRLLQGLVRDLVVRGSIKTTIAKAKAVQPLVDKTVTKAKENSRAAAAEVRKLIANKVIETMLFEDAKTRFANRSSGFTRIIRLGKRLGDATEEAILQFVDERVTTPAVAKAMAGKEVEKTEIKKPVKKKTVRKSVKK